MRVPTASYHGRAYVPAHHTGAVSSAEGVVRLPPKLAAADPATEATLSCIGYEERVVTLNDLASNATLTLTPTTYPLAVAEVTDQAFSGQVRRLGFRKDESILVSSYFRADDDDETADDGETADDEIDQDAGGAADSTAVAYGGEVANLMRIKGPWRLRSVGTNLETDAPAVFEINVYAYRDGAPAERLNRERVFLELAACTTQTHVQEIDFAAYDVRGTGPFVVAVELVGPGTLAGAPDTLAPVHLTFNSKLALGRRKRLTHYRAPDGAWRRTTDCFEWS